MIRLKPRCCICKSNQKRLVRDHNHVTGRLRGILCEQCNIWLGLRVSNAIDNVDHGDKEYKEWLKEYGEEIKKYNSGETVLMYRGEKSKQMLKALHEINEAHGHY